MKMRVVLVMVLMLAAAPAFAQATADKSAQKTPKVEKPSDNYDELYARYLAAARTQPVTKSAPDSSWMMGLMGDLRARRVNDLVTVRVVESISAVGSADSSLDKNSKGAAAVTNLFGAESRYPGWLDPTSLAALGTSTTFKGGGQTQRAGELTAVISARVVEVLPTAISRSRVFARWTSTATSRSSCCPASCGRPTSVRATSCRPRRLARCAFATSAAA